MAGQQQPTSRSPDRAPPAQATVPHHLLRPETKANTCHRFLAALRRNPNASAAARAAGVARTTMTSLRKRDPEFAAAWEEAEAEAIDHLEAVAYEGATEGFERKLVSKGEVVGTERVPDNRLIELLLTANRPAKYAQKHLHSGRIEVSWTSLIADERDANEARRGNGVKDVTEEGEIIDVQEPRSGNGAA